MDTEQQHVVLAAVNTILRFLRNDNKYVPFWATVMGCGGTAKSYIINTILTIVRKMTRSNTTLIIGAPSGSAAFNVQGSTLHHLLGISVARPELKCIGQETCEIRVDYSTLIKLWHARGCNREGEAEHLRSLAARKGSRKLSLA
jgi:hypothetical protein